MKRYETPIGDLKNRMQIIGLYKQAIKNIFRLR